MNKKPVTLRMVILLGLFSLSCQTSATMSGNSLKQTKPEAEALCDRLSEIKMLPFKNEPVDDEVYNKIMSQGQAIIPCLVDKITDLTQMKDPRSAPTVPRFMVGDLAFFLLVRITGIQFEQMLPDSVKNKMEDQGVYAYFEYVEQPDNRKELQQRWKAWLKEQNR